MQSEGSTREENHPQNRQRRDQQIDCDQRPSSCHQKFPNCKHARLNRADKANDGGDDRVRSRAIIRSAQAGNSCDTQIVQTLLLVCGRDLLRLFFIVDKELLPAGGALKWRAGKFRGKLNRLPAGGAEMR